MSRSLADQNGVHPVLKGPLFTSIPIVRLDTEESVVGVRCVSLPIY